LLDCRYLQQVSVKRARAAAVPFGVSHRFIGNGGAAKFLP
jgi:hypothetical protein